tara:strand:+ start:152 stop:541 length:390 start_codon:yes stop_codon:yes gene_type:complete
MTRKVSKLLNEYFDQSGPREFFAYDVFPKSLVPKPNSPIVPKEFGWKIHQSPERFAKTFAFNSRQRLVDFVGEVLLYEDELGHHGTLKVDYDKVTIEVYTHTVDRITEIDKDYVETVDQIYGDVLHFAY